MCQQRTDILQVSTLIVQFIEDRTGLAFRVKLKKFPQFFMFNREIKKKEKSPLNLLLMIDMKHA